MNQKIRALHNQWKKLSLLTKYLPKRMTIGKFKHFYGLSNTTNMTAQPTYNLEEVVLKTDD